MEVAAQDAVFIQARDLVERAQDGLADTLGRGFPRLRPERELGFEQAHQRLGDRRLCDQHAFHVRLAEGNTGLQQVAAVGAHHHDFARTQSRAQQQAIEAIVFDFAAPRRQESFLEQRLEGGDVRALQVARFELEVLDPHRAVSSVAGVTW